MDFGNEISSDEVEFNFDLSRNEIDRIQSELALEKMEIVTRVLFD